MVFSASFVLQKPWERSGMNVKEFLCLAGWIQHVLQMKVNL